MKTLTLFLIIYISFSFNLYSQKRREIKVEFEKTKVTLPEKYANHDSTYYNLDLKIEKPINGKDIYLKIYTKYSETADSTDSKIITDAIWISINDFKNQPSIKKQIALIIFSDTIKEAEETFKIEIECHANDSLVTTNKEVVVIINNSLPNYIANTPYKLGIGTNFDFIDKLKTNDAYIELSIYLPNLLRKTKNHSFGFYAGMFQNRNVSLDTLKTNVLTEYLLKTDINKKVQENITKKSVTTIDNLGLYFAPMFCLYNEQINTGYGLNIYVSFQLEVIQRNYITKYDYISKSIDTVNIQQNEQLNTDNTIDKNFKITKETRYEKFGGVTLPISYKSKGFELLIRPTLFGLSKQGCYYAYQFNIIENQYGICFGGEYRGYYAKENPAPLVNIYLIKVFDLTKLLEYKK